jgi:geranylgeranyl reductase family protein
VIYDVLVVGAGPGGAVLAYQLARLGLRVLIVERATLPRYKACGGGLPAKTIRRLPFDVSSVLEQEAKVGILSFAGQELLRAPMERPIGWFAMRDRFDHLLIERALYAGARLVDGVTVQGVAEASDHVVAHARGRGLGGNTMVEPFRARFLAGADGVLSTVARSTGLLPQRQTGVAIEAEVSVPSAAMERQGASATFDFGALPRGYGWIFPKAEHLSAGVFHAQPGKAVGLRHHLRRFLASHAVLRDGQHVQQRGHLIPLGGAKEPLHRGRVLLVGDAANLADPWLGEGIYWAVRSAEMAAHILVDAMDRGASALSHYTARVHAEITPHLRQAQHLAAFVYSRPRLCSVLLGRSRRMQDLVFGTIRGDWTLRQLNMRLTLHLPRILLQALREGHSQP